MKQSNQWLPAAIALLVVGCESGTGPEPGSEFTLEVGESVEIGALQVGVHFVGVAIDSRCPEGGVCIWAGDAEAALLVTDRSGGRVRVDSVTLHSHLEPNAVPIGSALLELVRVHPHPSTGEHPDPADYRITLVVR